MPSAAARWPASACCSTCCWRCASDCVNAPPAVAGTGSSGIARPGRGRHRRRPRAAGRLQPRAGVGRIAPAAHGAGLRRRERAGAGRRARHRDPQRRRHRFRHRAADQRRRPARGHGRRHRCLLCDEPVRALELATALDAINRERSALRQQTTDEAKAVLASISPAAGDPPVALCLHDPQWHAGVVGLVASKLAQRASPGGGVRAGATRRPNCAAPRVRFRPAHPRRARGGGLANPGLVERFGGHCDDRRAHAGGVEPARVRGRAARATVAAMLDPAVLQAELWTDGEPAPDDFDRATADLLRDGGP